MRVTGYVLAILAAIGEYIIHGLLQISSKDSVELGEAFFGLRPTCQFPLAICSTWLVKRNVFPWWRQRYKLRPEVQLGK